MAVLSLQVNFSGKDTLSPQLQNLVKVSEQLTSKLHGADEATKKLSTQQMLISRFTKQKQALQEYEQAWQQATKKIQQLKQEMAKSENGGTKQQHKELNKAVQEAQRLKQKFQETNQSLQHTRNKLSETGISVANLAQEQAKLNKEVSKNKALHEKNIQAIERTQKAQEKLNAITAKLDNIKQHAQTAFMTSGAVMAGLGSAVKNYADGENAQMNLKVSMMTNTGEVAEEFKQLDALANKLGTKLPGSTSEFQNMMATLVQQGISAKAILGGVGEASGYLAVQMKLPFAEAAEFAAKMQDATKTSEKDMLALMDTIQKAYYLGVDKTNMLSGYSKIADGMKTIRMEGLAGAKAIAPLLVMADQASMDGGSAGNAYSKIFSAMMKTKNIQKALKESNTGIDMNFTDGKGEFGGLDNMFKQLEKLKGLSTEQRRPILEKMFGTDAETIQALNLLIDKGQAGYNETLAKMNAQADLQTRVNAQLGTLTNLWDAAQGTFSSLVSRVGEALAPQIKDLTQWLTQLTEKFTNWSNQHPVLFNNIIKFIAVTATLVAIFAGLAIAITTILAPFVLLKMSLLSVATTGTGLVGVLARFSPILTLLKTGILGIGQAFLTAGRFMLANPMILAITALVAVIAGSAYLIYKHWDTIKAKVNELWQSVSNAFMTGINYIKGIIQSIDAVFANNPILHFLFPFIGIPRLIIANWSSISTFFSQLWTNVTTTISSFTQNISMMLSLAWNTITTLTSTALNAVWSVVSSIFSQISAYISTIMAAIRNIVSTAWTALCNVFLTITPLGYIMRNFDSIIAYLSGLKDRFYGMGANIIQGLVNGVQAGFAKLKSLWAEVNSYMPNFMQKRMDIHSPSRLFKSFGGYIMQGLNIGITKGIPYLQNQYGKVLDVFAQPTSLLQTGLHNPIANQFISPSTLSLVDKLPTYLQQSQIAHKAQGWIEKSKQASKNIVQSVLPSTKTSKQVSIAGDTITIHIHSTGQDVHSISQHIQQALQQRDREKSARVRDSFLDQI